MRTGKIAALCTALGFALLAVPNASRADTYFFTSDHCTGTCGTSPFAKVDVTNDGTDTLLLTVTLINATKIVNTGFDLSFGFNLVGNPSLTFSNVTSGFFIAPGTGGPPNITGDSPNPASATTLSMDGVGDFEYGLIWGLQGGGAGFTGTLSFDISAAGLTLSSFEQNANGQFFGLDIMGSNGLTGPVDASSLSQVPLPPAALLFGSALVGLGLLGRRRRKDRVALA